MTKSKKPTPKKSSKPAASKAPSKSESTSKKVAKVAARAIKEPEKATDDEVQTLAASALTQVDDEETTDAEDIVYAEVVEVPESAPDVDAEESTGAPSDASAAGDSVDQPNAPVSPLVSVVSEEAAASEFDDDKFRREMAEQVQAPVTYHFPTEAEAEQHAQVARLTLAPNGRFYRVQRDGVRVKVSLG